MIRERKIEREKTAEKVERGSVCSEHKGLGICHDNSGREALKILHLVCTCVPNIVYQCIAHSAEYSVGVCTCVFMQCMYIHYIYVCRI